MLRLEVALLKSKAKNLKLFKIFLGGVINLKISSNPPTRRGTGGKGVFFKGNKNTLLILKAAKNSDLK